MGGVTDSEETAHRVRYSIRAEHLQNVPADESPRFGRIMRRAGDAHGADARAGEPRGVFVPSSTTQRTPFAVKSAPCAPPQQDIRILFIITPAPIPGPQTE